MMLRVSLPVVVTLGPLSVLNRFVVDWLLVVVCMLRVVTFHLMVCLVWSVLRCDVVSLMMELGVVVSWLLPVGILMVSGLVETFVVTLEVRVLWSVRCESLVMSLSMMVRGAVFAVLMPFSRLVMNWHLVSGDVVLLLVVNWHRVVTVLLVSVTVFLMTVTVFLMTVAVFLMTVNGILVWLKEVELFFVKWHFLAMSGYTSFPVLSVIIASVRIASMVISMVITSVVSVLTVVWGTRLFVVGLVVLAVVRAVVLTLTVVVLSRGNSDNSSEGKRFHYFD